MTKKKEHEDPTKEIEVPAEYLPDPEKASDTAPEPKPSLVYGLVPKVKR